MQSKIEVEEAEIGVSDLVAWCQEWGLGVDGAARAQYTAERGRTGG